MSTCHIKKVNLLEASRHHSTPSATLNTTEISLNNANLENYKKALHNIVRRLNKTPSVSNNKTLLRRSESKLNQSQQTMYQTTYSNHNSNKKHHVSSNSISKNQSVPKRSQSNDGSAYKPSKDLLNKSMHEPYMRKESPSSNLLKSVSIQKQEKTEPQELEDIIEEKTSKNKDNTYGYETGVNSTILQEVTITNFDVDGDRKLKDLLHKFQLRDAVHRQEIIKLKKANDLLRSHVKDLEKEIDRSNQTKDLEKKYTQKLESELSNLKEKIRIESGDKKSSSQTAFDNKENKYLKMIDDLKAQVTNLTTDKKLVEQLLKSSLQQNEMSKENNRSDKKPSASVLNSVENSKNASASKPNNLGARIKTDNYMIKKKTEVDTCEDETDYSLQTTIQPLNTSFLGMNSKMSRDEKLKEIRDTNMSLNFEKITKMLNDGNTFTTLITDESDEPFPNKVSPPKLNNKSLKERMDMNQFRLDLTRLSKNRKVD